MDIDNYLDYLRCIKKYSSNTVNSYNEDITEYISVINKDIRKVCEEDIKKYLEYLYNKNISKSSISRKLSSIRGLYNYLYTNNKIDTNIFSDIHNPKKNKTLPNFLTDKEVSMLLDLKIDSIYFSRNSLIIELFYSTGIRVSELVNITLEDINMHDKTIKILGKGSKERIVYFGKYCFDKLNKYINDDRRLFDKYNSKYLILNKNGNKITTRQIENIINYYTFRCGLNKKISPHVLRHTFATSMLNNGADIVSVKEYLGHESISTTSIYTHVTNEKIRDVYNNCHPRS